jgi:hypothetical protein
MASKHLHQTILDMHSSIGNYFQFLINMELLCVVDLKLAMLWSMPHIEAWITWTDEQVSRSTKCNKAIHLVKLLKWLHTHHTIMHNSVNHQAICLVKRKLHYFAECGKHQYKCLLVAALNKEGLIKLGSALASTKQPVFIMWLLQKLDSAGDNFIPSEAEQAPKTNNNEQWSDPSFTPCCLQGKVAANTGHNEMVCP